MAQSDADYISFMRTINLPKRGIGDATIEKLRFQATQEAMPILQYCQALLQNQPLQATVRLSAKQKENLGDYLRIIHELRQISKGGSIRDTVLAAIEKTNYLNYLKEDRETEGDRKENLDELITKAVEWELMAEDPSLESFLEELSLKSSLDEAGSEKERLSLMTIHNGKGLEFQIVFLVGLEEDLFPHANSRDKPDAIEEERRLCYVGLTRAMRRLYLSHCHTRYLWGSLRTQRRSRFIAEIWEHIEKFPLRRFR